MRAGEGCLCPIPGGRETFGSDGRFADGWASVPILDPPELAGNRVLPRSPPPGAVLGSPETAGSLGDVGGGGMRPLVLEEVKGTGVRGRPRQVDALREETLQRSLPP